MEKITLVDNFVHFESTFDSFSHSKEIICTKCGGPVTNYDPGSVAYQEYYGKCLPAICEDCLDEIFLRVKRHNRRD